MATTCKSCGKEPGFLLKLFSKDNLCKNCITKITNDIINFKNTTKHQTVLLQNISKPKQLNLYFKIFSSFEKDAELDEKEMKALAILQDELRLSQDEIKYK